MASIMNRWRRWLQPNTRTGPPSPRFPPPKPVPDWSTFNDYYDLARAIHTAMPMSAGAFLDGPFRRFLELSSTDEHPRGRARTMEFATGAFRGQREAMAERGEPVDAFEARAWALAHEYLDDAPNGDYMIEVLEGRATHNYRAQARD